MFTKVIDLSFKRMRLSIQPVSLLFLTFLLSACDNQETNIAEEQANRSVKLTDAAFRQVDWLDLLPKEDLDALLNPPSYLNDIEEGSLDDQISQQLKSLTTTQFQDDEYQQALISTRIMPQMDGQAIQIPGFVVPLEFSASQTVTQFFLVPFFGACIHVPPPPPNQIILVSYPQGLTLESLYEPLWISGILSTTLSENDLATAAYSMRMHGYEPYTEPL